ncbi:carbohydrate ABC transporter membrane protein 2, CUT1 family [Leifsonia sp. 98AMF]|uniref:carbohydrate ABC transporter permease n=1 Tax=Microbacteriaceae TaxID=85023 RepID=UPI00039FB296|nr:MULTISPECIES: carbohydrate ABC transporter permease [Microbacteriaceae]SDH04280.1 carbohydrate ABC transporter membrane protein 2, CUT1 family [Leifsonia sp. 197AMF]SDJ36675.1 carbohydrate ABC transporter membrane protein 2, CUT1 family [Leifsonia sp. 466MF]SDK42741.1 carbohydrate ABC transporter membrane protein 2, CUT1 family [Leifsonia sp. 157MF]SDN56988.1 carbohydrate ABC transporter membrane protein 2, CUT1 family [Leifsonia sp. 509MF]SEN52620.1 carbohydrate ABC transporter membrane pr
MTALTAERRRASLRGWSGRSIAGVILVVFVLFFAIPIVWLLFAVTKSSKALIVANPFSVGSWSDFVANWNQLFGFQDGAVTLWIGNSALYSIGALIITLIVSIPAGYALALTEFRLRKALLVLTLVVMLIPSTALVLPIFLELNSVGLIGSPLSVILPMSFFPFGVYLTYIYFSTSIPRDLLAAARIDGCTEFQVFTRVALPLAAPIVALVAFFSFVQNWNNFFLPFVMLPSSDGYPIQVGLTSLLSATPAFNPSSAGSDSVQLPTLALATIVSILPVLIVFLFSQRFLVSGMTAGGTKE